VSRIKSIKVSHCALIGHAAFGNEGVYVANFPKDEEMLAARHEANIPLI
jgi:hypothetical protein